ncbi:MAG: HD domain-containing protein [Lachnospiraceae bacterium]|nr:HD domain-containing protein [Lachnospiraceae bacterium]
MERIDRIVSNPIYREKLKQLDELEQERIYCKHGMEHAVNVARIMYIRALEQGLVVDKEIIYAAALLHDLGRCDQYVYNIPHHEAGAKLAVQILTECGFDESEIAVIEEAIRAHRKEERSSGTFSALLYEADKLSRDCYRCKAGETCNWAEEKRNHTIRY